MTIDSRITTLPRPQCIVSANGNKSYKVQIVLKLYFSSLICNIWSVQTALFLVDLYEVCRKISAQVFIRKSWNIMANVLMQKPPHLCWLASLVAGWLIESYGISILIINQKIMQKSSCRYYFSEYSIVLSHGQNKIHF